MADLRGVDLLALIGSEVSLRKKAARDGGEYCGPCPGCSGRDRFMVWPSPAQGNPRYWCRQCNAKGDAADYLVWRGRAATVGEALKLLGAPLDYTPAAPRLAPPPVVDAPSATWQERAASFVAYAQGQLWSEAGEAGLAYLRGRGLEDDTIRAAGLGWNPKEWRDKDVTRWGLESDHDPIWLPVGVVIPWLVDGAPWLVKIRQPAPRDPKYRYVGIPGGQFVALYHADALRAGRPAVLVEGELDALAIQQAAGNLAAPVATGTTVGAHRAKWLIRLALAPRVLVALDNDGPGTEAAAWWLERLGERARRWPPTRKDPGDMLRDDGPAALRRWLADGLWQAEYTRCFHCHADAPDYRVLPNGLLLCGPCFAQAVALGEAA